MKTFLRNIPTRLYVQPAGGWTDKAEEALDFGGMRQALGFASQEGLSQMELVFPSGTLELVDRSGERPGKLGPVPELMHARDDPLSIA